ncbi:unnamed protein product [Linum trigynum]|uniref:Uncharacterized protein n=1 Tax=Linum trigynum TaxID=586398 RepID=A0AAV2G9C9_9ROSI
MQSGGAEVVEQSEPAGGDAEKRLGRVEIVVVGSWVEVEAEEFVTGTDGEGVGEVRAEDAGDHEGDLSDAGVLRGRSAVREFPDGGKYLEP